MENTQSEKDLISCLNATTKFVEKMIEKGFINSDIILKMCLDAQIESNKMTIKKYRHE